jgi:hypothetical protein
VCLFFSLNSRYDRGSTFNHQKDKHASAVDEKEEVQFHLRKIKLTTSHAEFIVVAC